MRFLIALLILGANALIQWPTLSRRGQKGELWAMLVLTALTLGLFALCEFRPDALQYPMSLLQQVFTPVGDWILGN
ncbi:MAG: hypothetical protein BAA04_07250 [Firmicutes bacterium ZCTH02-B6]|nr:MAG: hypothetical protein BAA04_07250 [Firmicutes bacterium ZCTH02-B6]